MPNWNDKRQPYPASWKEQRALLKELPAHLHLAALFAVNTGLRDQSQTNLSWDWEVPFPELNTNVFVIPGEYVKNGVDQVVVLNQVAAGVIESCRGQHKERVFTFKGEPVTRLANSAWKKARVRAGMSQFRWHDWRHTFARRLRSVRVSEETRAVLMGHKTQSITTHYSAAEVQELIDAVCLLDKMERKDGTLLRAIK